MKKIDLTPETIRTLAGLAGFSFAEDRLERLRGQFEAEMKDTERMRQVALGGIEPATLFPAGLIAKPRPAAAKKAARTGRVKAGGKKR